MPHLKNDFKKNHNFLQTCILKYTFDIQLHMEYSFKNMCVFFFF